MRYEAGRLGAETIETEHLLIGLAREDQALLFASVGPDASLDEIRKRLGVKIGEEMPLTVDLPLANSSKRVLAYAAEEMERFQQRHVGTYHLLLALLREHGCEAERVLKLLGADRARIREQIAAGEPAVYPEVQRVETAMPYRPPVPRPGGIAETGERPRIGFERYTEKARRTIFFARSEASEFGSHAVESEHLLLGMWREGAGLINELTGKQDAWPELRKRILVHSPEPRKKISTSVDMPLSAEVKEALTLAAEEMGLRNGSQVGIDDLLLGLLQVDGCFAAELLRERGANVGEIRKRRG